MPTQSNIVTLSTGDQLASARASHEIIHDHAPATFWEDMLERHPVWRGEGPHRAIFDGDTAAALTSFGIWEQRFGATTLQVGEIGLVGTLPDYRNRGLSRQLMADWIATARERAIPLMFLLGIPDFYERWDFHYACPDYVSSYLSVTHDPLAACAVEGGTVRSLNLDTDIEPVRELISREHRHTPCSPVIDAPLLRFLVDRAGVHGVEWQVIEDDRGEICAVVRWKSWTEGIGPQAAGAITLAAARDDVARGMLAALLRDHLLAARQLAIELAIPPHGPFGAWLFLRGARRKSDSSIYPGGYAAMYRINDLATVLEANRTGWEESLLVSRHAGTAVTIRAGAESAQVATIVVSDDGIEIAAGAGGVVIDAPPAVTVPWITGWRSAAAWLDRVPYPALPGPSFDPGNPDGMTPAVAALLRDLFPERHPFIGDMYQGG